MKSLALQVLSAVVLGNQCLYSNLGGSGWGGTCTCPDGTTYQVGVAAADDCNALECADGISGTCNEFAGPWSNTKALCGPTPLHAIKSCTAHNRRAPIPPFPRNRTGRVHRTRGLCVLRTTVPVVAYAFMVRDHIPYWDLWTRFFESCSPGTAVPIIHSQDVSVEGRAKLQAQVDPLGGKLVPVADVRQGDPRWNFLMVSIIFSVYRTAGTAVGTSGCTPDFVHILSESDAPSATCHAVSTRLGRNPGVSLLNFMENDFVPWRQKYKGPWESPVVPEEVSPLAHTAEWLTLAMPHARDLAAAECGM